MEWIEKIAILVIAPGTVLAGVTYLLHTMFERSINKSLVQFTADVDLKKSELSHIHEKKVEILGTQYAMLKRANRAMARLTSLVQIDGVPLPEKRKKAAEAVNEADDYFNENGLYLDEGLSAKTEAVLSTMKSAFIDFDTAQTTNEYKPDPDGYWAEAFKQISKDLPPVLSELKEKFQQELRIVERKL